MDRVTRAIFTAAAGLLLVWGAELPGRSAYRTLDTAVPGTVPDGVLYQGRLSRGGTPYSGTVEMTFGIYDAVSGGTLLWGPQVKSVTVRGGVFSAVFGNESQLSADELTAALAAPGEKFIEVQVNAGGGPVALAPRDPMRAVPYAKIAESVEGHIEISTGGFSINRGSDVLLYVSSVTASPFVGIGTTQPVGTEILRVVGGDVVIGTATVHNASADEDLFVKGNVIVDGTLVYAGTGRFEAAGINSGNLAAGEAFRVGTDALTVLENGNVGVNKADPGATLEVYAEDIPGFVFGHATRPEMRFETGGTPSLVLGHDGTTGYMGTPSGGGALELLTAGTTRMTLTSDGKVGVGISTPTQALDVNGSVNLSGTMTLGTPLVVGSGGTGASDPAGARDNLNVPSSTGAGAVGIWDIGINGIASSATAFATYPTACGVSGEWPKGVDREGDATPCVNITTELDETEMQNLIYDDDNSFTGDWVVTPLTGDINFDADTFVLDTSANRIGINNAAPAKALDVTGDVNLTGVLTLGTQLAVSEGGTGANDVSGARAYLEVPSSTGAGAVGIWDIGINGIASSATAFAVNPPDCTTTGEFPKGIAKDGTAEGCTDVTSELDEVSVENLIYDNDNTPAGPWTVAPTAGDINFDVNTFVVDVTNDRVGIGTPSPSTTLDVNGDVNMSGTLTMAQPLSVAQGGTGAKDAAGAQVFLDVPSSTGAAATGTWGISITGNAATATTANGAAANTVGASELNNSECSDGQVWKRGAVVAGQWGCGSDNNAASNESTTEGRIYDNDNTPAGPWTVAPTAGDISFDGTTFVVDVTNHRVGINKAAPSQALDVTGSINASGALTLGTALAVAEGGTGAATALAARANLDVPQRDGTGASGNWGIDISGTAAAATTANALAANTVGASQLNDAACTSGRIWQHNATTWACADMEGAVEGYVYDNNNAPTTAWAVDPTAGNDINFDNGTFRIDTTNHRVGINKAPGTALDVSGSATISGSITANGGGGDVPHDCAIVQDGTTATTDTATCTDKVVGGGGVCATGNLVSSMPSAANVWTVTCDAGNATAYAICCTD